MATQAEMYTGGVCFMNHPMKFGEVHIRGKHTSLELRQKQILEIGLTNINPKTIRSSVNKKDASRSTFKIVNCIPNENEGISESFHLCISLRKKIHFYVHWKYVLTKISTINCSIQKHPSMIACGLQLILMESNQL